MYVLTEICPVVQISQTEKCPCLFFLFFARLSRDLNILSVSPPRHQSVKVTPHKVKFWIRHWFNILETSALEMYRHFVLMRELLSISSKGTRKQ